MLSRCKQKTRLRRNAVLELDWGPPHHYTIRLAAVKGVLTDARRASSSEVERNTTVN
uniref:Fibronectin type-III domain-containing protein n=1 Tax=Parascaris equorum TaxID=6256 RepID=A0A914RMA5_PAREQ